MLVAHIVKRGRMWKEVHSTTLIEIGIVIVALIAELPSSSRRLLKEEQRSNNIMLIGVAPNSYGLFSPQRGEAACRLPKKIILEKPLVNMHFFLGRHSLPPTRGSLLFMGPCRLPNTKHQIRSEIQRCVCSSHLPRATRTA